MEQVTQAPAASALAGAPTDEVVDPLIGTVLGGYQVIRRLGRGGMGIVYLAEHVQIHSQVALKLLHPHLSYDPSLVKRFYAEARAVNLARHENILDIFDAGAAPDGRCYLLMEYLEGHPLTEMARGPVPTEVAIPVLTQVCDALSAAHASRVIHRDLKPENIFLIRRAGRDNFVKLLDFGVAKLLTPGDEESLGMVVGTPEFMAPEQILAGKVDGRADLYSLGVIAYQLATGRLPFHGATVHDTLLAHREKAPEPPHAVNPRVPRALSALIVKVLAKSPRDRFGNALEMKAALERVLAPRPAEVPWETHESPGGPKLSCFPQVGRETPTRAERPAEPQPASIKPVTVRVPRPERLAANLLAIIRSEAGQELLRARCTDLSRGGMFLCCDAAPPPLRARLRLSFGTPGRLLEIRGEVVRHVGEAEASAWKMSRGFAVQFATPLPAGYEAMLSSPASAAIEDPVAERRLTQLGARLTSAASPYQVLGVPEDADFPTVRKAARELHLALASLRERPLSPGQQLLVERGLEQEGRALQLLGTPIRRAEHDADHQNFRGVARCLAAGLTVTELDTLRKAHLHGNAGAEPAGAVYLATARAYQAQGDLLRARASCEQALAADPLNLTLHKTYWSLVPRWPRCPTEQTA